jgi:hypothetical protein
LIAVRRALPFVAVLAVACSAGSSGVTRIDVRVELGKGIPANVIVVLQTTVEDDHHSVTHDFARAGAPPLIFPTSFTIELGLDVAGPVKISVHGLDAARVSQAEGAIGSQAIDVGKTRMARLNLECVRNCTGDGGVDAAVPDDAAVDGPGPEQSSSCGNGELDPGETCDIAIPAGRVGACPPASCDDGIACTTDTRTGDACTARCFYAEIPIFVPGDGCCPANANHLSDPDCSATCGNGKIEPGETCDTEIPAGDPGSCPGAARCLDGDACTMDSLISALTCSARCVHQAITAVVAGDGCCPAGASNHTDPDCPEVCGNGYVDPSEKCDIARPAGTKGACPLECDVHASCFRQVVENSACQAVCRSIPITEFIADDKCCPPGANRALDSDCLAICGNGVLELAEHCDTAIPAGQQGACPTSCAPATGCMPRTLQGTTCSARCEAEPITTCSPSSDGCCPAGCTTATDPDCSATCGNGLVDMGETCDSTIPQPAEGSCPRQCDDSNACTTDSLLSGSTCNARCQFTPVATFKNSDGCCPLGGNHNVDTDCPFVCGNGVVEAPRETCDPAISEPAAPGACLTSCPAPSGCTQYTLTGAAADCSAHCAPTTITACEDSNDCCPPGCNQATDSDCATVCGDGVVDDSTETCDRAITAGHDGACPASCDDNNPCTDDSTSGRVEDCTRTCTHAAKTACSSGDRCCPMGCAGADSDCDGVCNDGIVQDRRREEPDQETCDPSSSCPTTCPDDGDPCTEEELTGTSASCDVTCNHWPIVTCSGSISDRCCPTPGCDGGRVDEDRFDIDCRSLGAALSTP